MVDERAPRVVVVGSGLAGPCLAHGLRRAGIDVALYERDAGVAARGQGYRIHVAPEGDLALRACLPPNLYDLVVATSGKAGTSGVTVYGPALEVLHQVTDFGPRDAEAGSHLSVDRLVLREVLTSGLDGAIRYGKAFTRFEQLPDGRVRVHFDDGSSDDADLLVGADGAGSLVRQQLLPQAVVVDTGLYAVFGKTPLTEEVRALAPEHALGGFSTVVGGDGRFMPLAAMEFRTDPDAAAAELAPGLRFRDTRDYLMWVLGVTAERLGLTDEAMRDAAGPALVDAVRRTVDDLHPSLGRLVELSDAGTVKASAMRTSVRFDHWCTGPVTFVGDAIHCMVPAGIGAAVALRDAALLTERLAGVARGGSALLDAVEAYEVEMLDHGFAAVEASQNVGKEFAR